MDLKKLLLFLIILKKYINEDELNFLLDGIKTFNNYDKILIEYSIKYNYVNNKHIKEDRILFSLKYNDVDYNKYFDFLNVKPVDIQDYKDSVYFSIDKSKNIKKIYFEKKKFGGFCNEYKDNLLDNVKNYKYIDNISSDMYNYIPPCLKKIIIDNTLTILNFKNKYLDVYQFILKDPIKYNEDFDCYVISICFDNDYNIKYHTYYLRNIDFAYAY
jgi:hypothetical protein